MGKNNNDWYLMYYDAHHRWALKHLNGSEYKVFTYMLSIIIRPKKLEAGFKNGKEVFEIYQHGHLLPVNASYDTIATNCNLDPKTVRRALSKFDEMGVMLKISKQPYGINNIYILGMRNSWHREDMTRSEYLFIDTGFLKRGEKMPDNIKKFIVENRRDKIILYTRRIGAHKKTLSDIFFPSQAEAITFNELRGVGQNWAGGVGQNWAGGVGQNAPT